MYFLKLSYTFFYRFTVIADLKINSK